MIVIAVDTYERLAHHPGLDLWLRKITLDESSPFILWIISGREDAKFVRQYRDYSQSERLLAQLALEDLTRNDIMKYLGARGVDPSRLGNFDELLSLIEEISKGIPLAVRCLVDMHLQKANLSESRKFTLTINSCVI
ncbi:MAG: hypothetical protein IPK19_41070 [Chloroflexi bacterium]|nr:hypothetical protein [Chloroflexota bacterium]